eukprot:TRINITY_DN12434_c0_g1_i1.p1 TRINITY_DN12434_c0_g1~~TRINITY_DN12434_c0_g1_i1.p1  ORF type:complete len:450 (-),score=115.74 TRINITY_DN12434_c0_g1_i1:194-1543(-)
MIRIKRVHRSLVIYVITFYTIALLVYQHLLGETTERVLEQVVEYENYNWVKLSKDVFVLSAYYENRPLEPVRGPFVRVLTIARHNKELLVKKSVRDLQPKTYGKGAFDVVCSVEDDAGEAVDVEYEAVIFEEGGERFAATFINCFLKNSDIVPMHVRLSDKNKSVRIPVKSGVLYQADTGARSNKSSVCVRALFGPYDNVEQIGQFMSYYNSVLGASLFTFYLLDVTDRVKYLLGHIQSQSQTTSVSVNLVDWNLPDQLRDWEELWDYGALIALTDCVYSNMVEYGYAFIVDMDEFIVPKEIIASQSTQALVNRIGEYKRPPINKSSDAFLFKNTFFCSEFNEETDFDENFDLFSIPFREDFLWSYKLRAKMLVRTKEVVAVGHHRIYDWVRPNVSYNTPVPNQVRGWDVLSQLTYNHPRYPYSTTTAAVRGSTLASQAWGTPYSKIRK